MASSSLLCAVCLRAPHKYRCPTCRARYCSAACFKAHAPTCAAPLPPPPPPPPAAAAAASRRRERERDDGDDEEGVRVPPERLARLGADAALRAALRDSRLQAVLRSVDAAPDRAAALAEARRAHGPRLGALLDDMLVAVGAAERLAPGEGGAGAGGFVRFVGLPSEAALAVARHAAAADAAAAALAAAAAAAASLPLEAMPPPRAVYGDEDDGGDGGDGQGREEDEDEEEEEEEQQQQEEEGNGEGDGEGEEEA
jgi:hypothetical protein